MLKLIWECSGSKTIFEPVVPQIGFGAWLEPILEQGPNLKQTTSSQVHIANTKHLTKTNQFQTKAKRNNVFELLAWFSIFKLKSQPGFQKAAGSLELETRNIIYELWTKHTQKQMKNKS